MDNELILSDDNRLRNSFLLNEEHSNNCVELKKKRKLQCILENVTLPLSKYQFRDRLKNAIQDNVGNPENMKGSLKELAFQVIRDEPRIDDGESTDSENEGYDTTMTLDLNDEEEETSGESFPKYLPSTSSSSTRNSITGNNIDPFYDEKGTEASKRVREDLEAALQTDKRYKGDDVLEGCDGHNFSETAVTGAGHIDGELEDIMLYSNGEMSPFLDPSVNMVRPKKPTIDQEFEQYFSMLML